MLKPIPDFTRYALNEQGDLKNVITNNFLKCYINESGYPCVRLWCDSVYGYRIRRLHRLMMLTFRPTDYSEELDVNHKNGIKTDFTLDNLEWVTRGENNFHAYQAGLNPNSFDVMSKDQATGELAIYKSLQEFCSAKGLNRSTVSRELSSGFIVAKGKYILKSVYDNTDWADLTGSLKEKQDIKYRTYDGLMSYNIEDAVATYHPSISAAAKACGLNRSGIKKRLERESLYPLRGYMFKKVDDSREWPEWTEEELIKQSPERTTRIEIVNVDTGDVKLFGSLADLARYFGLNPLRGCNVLNSLKREPGAVYKGFKLNSLSK